MIEKNPDLERERALREVFASERHPPNPQPVSLQALENYVDWEKKRTEEQKRGMLSRFFARFK